MTAFECTECRWHGDYEGVWRACDKCGDRRAVSCSLCFDAVATDIDPVGGDVVCAACLAALAADLPADEARWAEAAR